MSDLLLHRVAAGDAKAIRECVARYGGLVWSLARKMFPKKHDAEDAVQEVFIQLWRKADQFDPGRASESTFVGVLARRRMIDILRKQKTNARELTKENFEVLSFDDDRVDTSDEVDMLRGCWQNLTDSQQEILSHSIYDGLSYSQISTLLSVPLGTVKTRARSGLKALRAHYRSRNLPSSGVSASTSKEMPQ